MGARKRHSAEAAKAIKKQTYFAKLNDVPTSPRKMRLVADLIKGKNVNHALNILQNTQKEASGRLHKLLLSAIANWQNKNEGIRIEDADSNHISLIIADRKLIEETEVEEEEVVESQETETQQETEN